MISPELEGQSDAVVRGVFPGVRGARSVPAAEERRGDVHRVAEGRQRCKRTAGRIVCSVFGGVVPGFPLIAASRASSAHLLPASLTKLLRTDSRDVEPGPSGGGGGGAGKRPTPGFLCDRSWVSTPLIQGPLDGCDVTASSLLIAVGNIFKIKALSVSAATVVFFFFSLLS